MPPAVTAITVQNTRGVAQVEYLSPETVGRQCGAVIEDLSPDAVKIGMTGTPAIISAIAEVLERYGCRNVVFDPCGPFHERQNTDPARRP